MPYTDDPTNNPADRVRLYVGYKATDRLSDAEVDFFLEEESGDALRAAARSAEALAAVYSREAQDKQVGPLRVANRRQSQTDRYMKLAKLLWSRAAMESGAGPYAGGISQTDKDTKTALTDLAQPSFKRDLMKYPGGTGVQQATDQQLRP